MDFIRNEETRNVNALLRALKSGDSGEISKYRALTGIKEDYETVSATVRYVQLGMAATYADAAKIYASELAIKKETESAKGKAQWRREFIEKEKDMATRGGANPWDLSDAQRELRKSEEELSAAKDYRSIWRD